MATQDMTQGGMYLVIPAPVAEDVHLRERSKLIYGRIVQLASSTGFCYASNQALLAILSHEDPKTGETAVISERTLQNVLAELRDRGHIHMDTGPIPRSDGGDPKVGRRIFLGQKLADMPPAQGGEENCTPENFCTGGVKKSAPPLNSKNNTSKTIPPLPPKGEAEKIAQILFDRFWAAYPRKRGKQDALKAWKKLAPDMELCREMSAALKWQKQSEQWLKDGGKYVPYPGKWLRQRLWEDEPDGPGETPYNEEGYDGI